MPVRGMTWHVGLVPALDAIKRGQTGASLAHHRHALAHLAQGPPPGTKTSGRPASRTSGLLRRPKARSLSPGQHRAYHGLLRATGGYAATPCGRRDLHLRRAARSKPRSSASSVPRRSGTSRSTRPTSRGRDSLIVLAAYASRTERIKLGTGVPADLLAHPGGHRAVRRHDRRALRRPHGARASGVAHQVTVENWFGTTIGKPVREMRDYAGHRARDLPPARTRRNASASRRASVSWATPPGPTSRSTSPRCPPAMLRLAGQIGGRA